MIKVGDIAKFNKLNTFGCYDKIISNGNYYNTQSLKNKPIKFIEPPFFQFHGDGTLWFKLEDLEDLEDNFIFPKNNWYLRIDDENRDIVNNWRINIIKVDKEKCIYEYINYEGWGGFGWDFVLITTEQFKKYVLNNVNYSSLENLLNKLNIK